MECDIKKLLSNLCCSICRNDFDENSLKIIEQKGNTYICHLECTKCGKDFGEIILVQNHHRKNTEALEVVSGAPPIDSDDVINAHIFIRDNL